MYGRQKLERDSVANMSDETIGGRRLLQISELIFISIDSIHYLLSIQHNGNKMRNYIA